MAIPTQQRNPAGRLSGKPLHQRQAYDCQQKRGQRQPDEIRYLIGHSAKIPE
jgi:hypothetical protein